jgi:hypothetical protein
MKFSKVLFSLFAGLGFVVMFGPIGSVDAHAISAQKQFPCLGKKFGQFEVLAVKKNEWSQDDPVCNNNGNRVFFQGKKNGFIGTINWIYNPDTNGSLNITDCDETGDNDVDVDVSLATAYWVVVKLVGPKTDELRLICKDVLNPDGTTNEDICAVAMVDLTRHDGWTKIIADLLADDQESVVWDLYCTGNGGSTCARHMKVQLFEADECT